jgi:hypothetical protein
MAGRSGILPGMALAQRAITLVEINSETGTCANSAGRDGAKTILLELCPGLGGTGTVGGVSAHWYGWCWAGFAIRNANLTDEMHKSISWPTSANKKLGVEH